MSENFDELSDRKRLLTDAIDILGSAVEAEKSDRTYTAFFKARQAAVELVAERGFNYGDEIPPQGWEGDDS